MARSLGGAVAVLVVAGTAAAACANALDAGADDPSDGGPPPVLVAPNDGGDAASFGDAAPAVLMCVATECPPPFATCLVNGKLPTYRCGIDLSNDVQNCGACGRACGKPPAGIGVVDLSCVSGECHAVCLSTNRDCNGIVDDGCEVDPSDDPNNCGACGVQCPSGVPCRGGECTPPGCPSGRVECSEECVDLNSHYFHCGECDHRCEDPPDAGAPPPNMLYGCANAECGKLQCITPFRNCNGTLDDGCEVNIQGDPKHCGRCGNACEPGQSCVNYEGRGIWTCVCAPGMSLCRGSHPILDRCRDLDSDPNNCGSCGFVCPDLVSSSLNRRAICERGRCSTACLPGFADCNGRIADGCEADLFKDPHNCGACEAECDNGVGQPCVNGQCATRECDAGPVSPQ